MDSTALISELQSIRLVLTGILIILILLFGFMVMTAIGNFLSRKKRILKADSRLFRD